MPLYVHRLTETAKLPTRATEMAAGLDLYADVSATVWPLDRALIPIGVALALDPGQCGLVWPRSGLAVNSGITVGAGVIDADYRGEIKVLLINLGDEPYYVQPGDRIAQLLIQPTMRPTITEMDLLPRTDRGKAGFGSTGL